MAVSPCTVWCSMDARAATSHTSPGSLRSATHAQRLFPATASAKGFGRPVPLPPDTRLNGRPFPATAWAEGGQCNGPPSSAGTLVHVLEPPVKDGVNPVRMRSGFMSWSTGHGLVTMLELHALSVRQGGCVAHRGLCMRRWHEELLLWQRNRSMFVYGVSTPAAYGGCAGPSPGDAALARSHNVCSSL